MANSTSYIDNSKIGGTHYMEEEYIPSKVSLDELDSKLSEEINLAQSLLGEIHDLVSLEIGSDSIDPETRTISFAKVIRTSVGVLNRMIGYSKMVSIAGSSGISGISSVISRINSKMYECAKLMEQLEEEIFTSNEQVIKEATKLLNEQIETEKADHHEKEQELLDSIYHSTEESNNNENFNALAHKMGGLMCFVWLSSQAPVVRQKYEQNVNLIKSTTKAIKRIRLQKMDLMHQKAARLAKRINRSIKTKAFIDNETSEEILEIMSPQIDLARLFQSLWLQVQELSTALDLKISDQEIALFALASVAALSEELKKMYMDFSKDVFAILQPALSQLSPNNISPDYLAKIHSILNGAKLDQSGTQLLTTSPQVLIKNILEHQKNNPHVTELKILDRAQMLQNVGEKFQLMNKNILEVLRYVQLQIKMDSPNQRPELQQMSDEEKERRKPFNLS